eukprot:16452344-Heterocapsa_arctica.AAC.2
MALLLVLLYMGLHKGWWKNMSELPLFNRSGAEVPDDDSDAGPEDEPELAPGASSSSGAAASSSSSSGAARLTI